MLTLMQHELQSRATTNWRRVVQVFAHGVRILDGSYMTQELNFGGQNSESTANSDTTVVSASIADPCVLLRMSDGSSQLLLGDSTDCSISVQNPPLFPRSPDPVSACSLYHDKGPEPWLRKTSTDAWLSTGVAEAIDGTDGSLQEQGDIYCLVCFESGTLKIFDVPYFNCVFSDNKFLYGKTHLVDTSIEEVSKESQKNKNKASEEAASPVKRESTRSMKIVELAMQRWSGQYSRPFLFGILNDGTVLCYHAYLYEGQESSKEPSLSPQASRGANPSRLRNLRFVHVFLDTFMREEPTAGIQCQKINIFKNVGGYEGLFLSGTRPVWFMLCRECLRVHPQGFLKICQLPSTLNYDSYWPVQKISLRGTLHQITYFSEKNLYPLVVSVPVIHPLNQVLSYMMDQEFGHSIEQDNINSDDLQRTYTIDEFEVRILEPERSGAHWETRQQFQCNLLKMLLLSVWSPC